MAKKSEIEKIPKSDTNVIQKWTPEDREAHLEKLGKAVRAYKKSFLDIALNLYWLDETGCLNNRVISVNVKPYTRYIKNIAEFAFEEYGISKATTYQYIAIVKKFGKINPDTGYIDRLDEKYKDYNVTALMVMVGMDDFQLFQCKPDMKIKELKALRDGSTNAIEDKQKDSTESNTENNNNDTIPPEPKQKPWENHNSQKLFEINDIKDFEERSSGIMDAIKKTLSQNNGKQYHVEVNMVWD